MNTHNPDNLTQKDIDPFNEGYRLLNKDEIISDNEYTPSLEEVEAFIERFNDGTPVWSANFYGASPNCTYRTKLAPEELRNARNRTQSA